MEKAGVTFSESQGKLFVNIQHRHPVVTWEGEMKLAIPVSVTSSYLLPPPRN